MKNHRNNESDDNIQSPEFIHRKSSMSKRTPIAIDTGVNQPPEWALASPGMAVLVEDPSINWAISERQVSMQSDETFLKLHEYAGLGQHEKILEKFFIFHVAKYSTSVPKDERLIDRGDDKVSS
jgi:hypothetical protein